jgi:hypothetical protein
MRILVLFTIVSLEEGDGAYFAAVARDAPRCVRWLVTEWKNHPQRRIIGGWRPAQTTGNQINDREFL